MWNSSSTVLYNDFSGFNSKMDNILRHNGLNNKSFNVQEINHVNVSKNLLILNVLRGITRLLS